MPRAQFVALVLGLLAWSAIFYMLIYPPLDAFFIENVFSWLPDAFFLVEDFSRYSTGALVITWVLGFVVNAVAGPMAEEMYFRGYLLPRISRFGVWAPLVNTVLFTIYHFFTPPNGSPCSSARSSARGRLPLAREATSPRQRGHRTAPWSPTGVGW